MIDDIVAQNLRGEFRISRAHLKVIVPFVNK